MSLPSKSIDEILEKASNRHKTPSPRGVADRPNDCVDGSPSAAATVGENKVAGSAVQCIEYASSSARYSPSSTVLAHFSNEQTSQSAIEECAMHFLRDVVSKTITMTEHCYRMTFHPADVSRSLELFVTVNAGGMWYRSFLSSAMDEDEAEAVDAEEAPDENWKDGQDASVDEKEAIEEDHTLHYDGSDSEEYDEEMVYIDEKKYNLTNTNTPLFDASYPAIVDNEIQQLSNGEFREYLLLPILKEYQRSSIPFAEGSDTMLKCAMYAFLVAKLSS